MTTKVLPPRLGGRYTAAYNGGVHVLIGFLLIAVVFPVVFDNTSLFTWTTAAVWVLFAMSTNVLFGWTGLLTFGQAAFFGMGAYTLGVLNEQYPGAPGLLLILVGAVLSAAVGALFAAIALRTSGPMFAILTLVFAQLLWLLVFRVSWLRGDDGFSGFFDLKIIGSPLESDLQLWYYVMAIVGVCTWILWLLHRSTAGMAMRAVRDDPWRAVALGIKVRKVQVGAFAVGAAFSAIAGALIVQTNGVVGAGLLGFELSGEVMVICLIGGYRVFGGPMLGAIVLIWMQSMMNSLTDYPAMYVGIILLIVVLVLPAGLASIPTRVAESAVWRKKVAPRLPSWRLQAPVEASEAAPDIDRDLEKEGVR